MTAKSDSLALLRNAFMQRWASQLKDYRRPEFEVDLDRLLYAAFAVAQEPFIRELEAFKEHALKTTDLLCQCGLAGGDFGVTSCQVPACRHKTQITNLAPRPIVQGSHSEIG